MTLGLSILTSLAASSVPHIIASIMFFCAFFKRHLIDYYIMHKKPKIDNLSLFLFIQSISCLLFSFALIFGGTIAVVFFSICSIVDALSPILIFKHFDSITKK